MEAGTQTFIRPNALQEDGTGQKARDGLVSETLPPLRIAIAKSSDNVIEEETVIFQQSLKHGLTLSKDTLLEVGFP